MGPMLASLSIRNIVLIQKLDLEFSKGLSVLTGETGAGKSILLDALGLATGARAESGLVTKGATQSSVTAVFEVADTHPVNTLLAEQALDDLGGQVLLRRTLSSDGRSKAFINDQPVAVSTLNRVGEALVEVHGQQDDRGLLDPAGHRRHLDAFGGHSGLLKNWQPLMTLTKLSVSSWKMPSCNWQTPVRMKNICVTQFPKSMN